MKPFHREELVTIYCGDCRDIISQLGIFDLVVTDPPYGVGVKYEKFDDTRKNLQKLIASALPMILASGIVTLITCGNNNQYLYPEPDWTLAWYYAAGSFLGPWGFSTWQPILAYGKDPYLRESLGGRADAVNMNEESDSKDIKHPCPKPLKFCKWLITRGTTKTGSTILDPFCGSGATLVAARQLGHHATGIEISEEYCRIAVDRLKQRIFSFPSLHNDKNSH